MDEAEKRRLKKLGKQMAEQQSREPGAMATKVFRRGHECGPAVKHAHP